ncbi:capsule biosynthesis protein [Anianabacter salinae]|uniref:capsule biosynthesis protein n=1 Tax=Anianabacter salinae TaxID=2851023 RepID=UPI00225E64CC|nr:capsule biosynthesis protein [Anianabacter salinae]MBV0910972.1 capsule biosynthesis protein [Anianabacter salinae]
MTIKPKAKKFRIRRNAPAASTPSGDERTVTPARPPAAPPRQPQSHGIFDQDDDGFGTQSFPTARRAAPSQRAPEPPHAPQPSETDLDAIRREGLTGRQLRMARRVAQKHGLAPMSDFDAVKQLRERGIDPFDRANMLELVSNQSRQDAPVTPNLPQTVRQQPQLPSTEVLGRDERAKEIIRMQRDIARRRRRKLAQLGARLAFFVGLPTLLVGYYYYNIATPMFETKTEFVIQQAEPQSTGGLGGLLSGTGFATSQDSITVQGYLQSREAMLRLNKDLDFRAHFEDPAIDPLQRLDPEASMEDAFDVYQKAVKIGYDPTEGVIKLAITAADPDLSEQFARQLVDYAEEQVDQLTQRLREDQMRGAREGFEEAEAKVLAAQQRVQDLQERLGVFDPMAESSTIMTQVARFETQAQEKQLQLSQLLSNPRPNQARVDGVRSDIERLDALVADLRSQLTNSTTPGNSMAQVTGQLRIAESELQTRQLLLTQALQQMESARIEANRQTRYLSMGVSPVAPDEATYPRKLENTVLALLIFAGIYLMVSLTASILREQVSS